MAKKVNPSPKLPHPTPPHPKPQKPPLGIASRPRVRPVFSRKRWLLYFHFCTPLPKYHNFAPKDPTHPQTLLFLCYFFFLCVFCVVFFFLVVGFCPINAVFAPPNGDAGSGWGCSSAAFPIPTGAKLKIEGENN